MTGKVVLFPSALRQRIGEDDLEKVDSELASIDEELEKIARARRGLMLRRKEVLFRYRGVLDAGAARWVL